MSLLQRVKKLEQVRRNGDTDIHVMIIAGIFLRDDYVLKFPAIIGEQRISPEMVQMANRKDYESACRYKFSENHNEEGAITDIMEAYHGQWESKETLLLWIDENFNQFQRKEISKDDKIIHVDLSDD